MTAIVAVLLFGQIAITGVRRTNEQIPINLSMNCALSGDAPPARQVRVEFRGSIGRGRGVRVTLTHEPGADIETVGDHDGVLLNGADDHTQNQIFNNFVVRVGGQKYLATLSIDYPAAMPRPASFDNSVAIKSAELELEDLKYYRSVTVGSEQLYVTKIKGPPVYAHGTCVLRDTGGIG